jgi:hypothetical protein
MKGSTSMTLYKVEVNLDLGNATMDHPLKILNLDCWDMILGSYFCEHYNVPLIMKIKPLKLVKQRSMPCRKMKRHQHEKPCMGLEKAPQNLKCLP